MIFFVLINKLSRCWFHSSFIELLEQRQSKLIDQEITLILE